MPGARTGGSCNIERFAIITVLELARAGHSVKRVDGQLQAANACARARIARTCRARWPGPGSGAQVARASLWQRRQPAQYLSPSRTVRKSHLLARDRRIRKLASNQIRRQSSHRESLFLETTTAAHSSSETFRPLKPMRRRTAAAQRRAKDKRNQFEQEVRHL